MDNDEIVFDSIKMDKEEVVGAYVRFRDNGYTYEDLSAFLLLAKKLFKKLPTEKERRNMLALMKQAGEEYNEHEAERIEKNKGVITTTTIENINLETAFPKTYPTMLKDIGLNSDPAEVISKKNVYDDRALVLSTPFYDDLEFIVNAYAYTYKKHIRYIDFEELIEKYKSYVPSVLHKLIQYYIDTGTTEDILVYKNTALALGNESIKEHFTYYLYLLRRKCPKVEQIVLSSDVFDAVPVEYKKCLEQSAEWKTIGPALSYLKTLNSVFIYPVSKQETTSLLKQRYNLQKGEEVEELLERDGFFLGYKRFYDVMTKDMDAQGLKDLLGTAKSDYRENLDTFINNSSYRVGEWLYSVKKKEETAERKAPIKFYQPEFKFSRDTYDMCIGNEEILQRLEKIMARTDESLQVRCAWAICYALTGGDSLNVINVPQEYAEEIFLERWKMAYSALCILLCLDEGQILFDIKERSPWGLCCDGGARIRMNEIFLVPKDDYALKNGVGVLLHELFHAVQYRAINAKNNNERDIFNYYVVNLNIYGYIDEWAENNTRYRSPEDDDAGYRDQVVEASARAFATECMYEFGNFSPPRLD